MTDDEAPYVELTPEMYPFTLEFFRVSDDQLVHTITVDAPGPVRIPGLAPTHGPVWSRTTYGNGEIFEAHP